MGRPVFPYELDDPDFSWLISNFQENNPDYCFVESGSLPLVLIGEAEEKASEVDDIIVPEQVSEDDCSEHQENS